MAAARHLLLSLVCAIPFGVGRRALSQDKSHCKEICIGAFLLPSLNHFSGHQPSATSHRTSDIRHDTHFAGVYVFAKIKVGCDTLLTLELAD
jgi:hypothetical protein